MTSRRFLPALWLSLCAASLAASPPEDPATDPAAPFQSEAPTVKYALTKAELDSSNLTANAVHEGETAVTALKIAGLDHTIAAYMRWDGTNSLWRVRTAKSTNLSSWLDLAPTLPAGHRESVDPVLDVNPQATGAGPLRTYLGGLTYNASATGVRQRPEAIVVWRSSNGGSSWSSPVKVEENVGDASFALDKPDVGVSWYTPTRGWLFVAYARVNSSNNFQQTQILVARSTNGGVSFEPPVPVVQGKVHAPQVFVSSATGRVYVVYGDFQANQIRMAISSDHGLSWTTETAASANLVSPFNPGPGAFNAGTISGSASCGVWAITIPMARYNHVKDAIGVVWHEREIPGSSGPTTVFFAAKTAAGWQPKVNLTEGWRAGDQWQPALDFDSLGNFLIAFPDRSRDPNNRYFRQAWIRTNHLGQSLESGSVAKSFDSDPAVFQEAPGRVCFRGDYQDVWYWPYSTPLGGVFQVLWSGNPVEGGALHDIYLSSVR